jgi:hypothetical protein
MVALLTFVFTFPLVAGVYLTCRGLLADLTDLSRPDQVALSFLAALVFLLCVSVNAWEHRNDAPRKPLWRRWIESRARAGAPS